MENFKETEESGEYRGSTIMVEHLDIFDKRLDSTRVL